jgi:SRSO17 transposase
MASSSRFASNPWNYTPYSDSLSLRLRYPLTLLQKLTSQLIMQKARRRSEELRPLVDTGFQVLFHSSSRGAFHLSLTVLVHYRSVERI